MSDLDDAAAQIVDTGIADELDLPEEEIPEEEESDDGSDSEPEGSSQTEREPESRHDAFEPYKPTVTPEQVRHAAGALQQESAALAQAIQHAQAVDAQIPWDQLRIQDPARWQQMQAFRQQAMAQLSQRAQQLQAVHGQVQQAVLEEQARGERHNLTVEGGKVARALGEDWNENTKLEIAAFLQDLGYTNEQIRGVTAKDVILAYKALQADRPVEEDAPQRSRRRPLSAARRAEQEISRSNVRSHSLRAAELRIAAAMDDGRLKGPKPVSRSRITNTKIPKGLSLKDAAGILERMM